MGVRTADIPDMDTIIELARELKAQSIYRDVKEDEQKFRLTVANMMNSRVGVVLVVAGDDDRPQGFLLGMVEEIFFSRERYATDVAIYVRRQYRNHAKALIAKFVEWARTKPKVKHIMLGISSGIDPERTGELYSSLGFSRIGGIYFQEL